MAARKKKETVSADPFATLLNEAVEAPSKTPGKKKERITLKVSDENKELFDRFCMADVVEKMAKGNQESAKAIVKPIMVDELYELWCKERRRTDNPLVQTENGRAILQVQENLKFELPVGEDGKGSATELLTSVGFTLSEATKIRQAEFSETTELRFGNISKLREDDQTKKVVDKLLGLVVSQFTKEERDILLEKVNKVEIKEGFLDRAPEHAKYDPAKLKALLNAIKPRTLFSGIVWSGDLQDATKTLQKPAPEKPQTFSSADGWKAIVNGKEAKLYEGEVLVSTKPCTSFDHAKMTAQKWMKDPLYRAEYDKRVK